MRRLALVAGVIFVAAAGTLAARQAEAQPAFTPAVHRQEPILSNHNFLLDHLRVVTIVQKHGAVEDPTTIDSKLEWFGVALTHGSWYRDLGVDYRDMGSSGNSRTIFATHVHAVDASFTVARYQDYVYRVARDLHVPRVQRQETIFLVYLDCDPSVQQSFHACASGFHKRVDLSGSRAYQSSVFGPTDSLAFVTGNGPITSTNLDTMTETASHEVIEAGTNPGSTGNGVRQAGWYIPVENPPWTGSPWSELQDGNPGAVIEVGDMGRVSGQHIRLRFACGPHAGPSCNSATATSPEGSYAFARIYSPTAAYRNGDPDVPPTPVPYYSVSTNKDWYRVSKGHSTVNVPVRAWSVTNSPPWRLRGSQLAGPGTCSLTGLPKKVQNGTVVAVGATISSPHPAGTWCVFELKSHRYGTEGAGATADQGGDDYHSWVFGVYYDG